MTEIPRSSKAYTNKIIGGVEKNNKKNRSNKSSESKVASSVQRAHHAHQEFIKAPNSTTRAEHLYDEKAVVNIPEQVGDIFSCSNLDLKGNALKCFLGILHRDIQLQDQPKFTNLMQEIGKPSSKFLTDKEMSSDISYLFQTYGKPSLSRFITDYKESCRNAWKAFHPGHDEFVKDEDIFTLDKMACIEILDTIILCLNEPNQTWDTLICDSLFFRDVCVSLSKTLRYKDWAQTKQSLAGPVPKSLPENAPSAADQFPSVGREEPAVSIPAGNGHGPITIHNTANGGNGISTINGNATERSQTSDIDFGIALLNTPDSQLGNKKLSLVEKFMDLHWARANHNGNDKLVDHLESVSQHTHLQPDDINDSTTPEAFSRTEELDSTPTSQLSVTIDSSPNMSINRIGMSVNSQEMMGSNKLASSEAFAAELLENVQAKFHSGVMPVVQTLSSLLTKMDTSGQVLESILPNKPPKIVEDLDIEAMQDMATPDLLGVVDSTINVTETRNNVSQLIKKFEALNTPHQKRDGETNLSSSDKNTDYQDVKQLAPKKSAFQPVKNISSKFNVNVPQIAVYTTNRTIDPFSRHGTHSFNKKTDPDILIQNGDLVDSI